MTFEPSDPRRGCVEADISRRAYDMLNEKSEIATARFGFSEETAFAHGLTCGGEIEILLERVDIEVYPEFGDVCEGIAAGDTVTIATLIPGSLPTDQQGSHLWEH